MLYFEIKFVYICIFILFFFFVGNINLFFICISDYFCYVIVYFFYEGYVYGENIYFRFLGILIFFKVMFGVYVEII